MSTVKASVWEPPVTNTENINIETITDTENLEKFIYVLMIITIIIFIKKLISTVCPKLCRSSEVKRE